MVFNTTFNNISVTCISWRSDLFVEETRVPGEKHWPCWIRESLYENHSQT